MCTAQKYPLLDSRTNAIEQTAVLAADEFITQNTDLIGLYLGDLQARLTERLQATPVQCSNVLDAISLLRAFVPAPPAYTPSHYGLMLRGELIVGLVWIPVHHDIQEQGSLFVHNGDTRELTRQLLACDATVVVLATTVTESILPNFAGWEADYDHTEGSLAYFDVKLLDWLFLYPDENVSLRTDNDDNDDCRERVAFHGLNASGLAN